MLETKLANLFTVKTVNSGEEGPILLITAGVHGDEYEPIIAAQELVKKIEKRVIRGKVIVIAIVNESAFKLDNRVGEDQLDLARTCPGKADGTLTERLAFEISEVIKSVDYFIDMHTGGKLFDIYPLAGYMLHSNEKVLEEQRKMAEAFNFPVIWGTDQAPNGRTLSVARDANVPAIYLEYGGGTSIQKEIVDAYTDGCLNVMAYLGMTKPTTKKVSQIKYKVEDFTPNYGNLQAKLPAAISGMFMPLISNGEKISKGDLWGMIKQTDNDKLDSVYADEEGVVLFIRQTAFVKKGDSLGGILSIKNNKI